MAALTKEEVLRDEAKAIHGKDLSDQTGPELYQELNKLNSVALCLSGGGIRSAAFALGIIQALAAHPRPPDQAGNIQTDHKVTNELDSLLAKFHYLSTVSGGGYIGGWLSAWIARSGFRTVWQNLSGRPDGPNVEPANLAWLRTFSNYLTPKLGALSADTWAAAAVFLRNLLLNWLVILPFLCALILTLKLYAGLVAWIGLASPQLCSPFLSTSNPTLVAGTIGLALLFSSLTFRSYNLPTRQHSSAAQRSFLWFDLLPILLAALCFVWALATPCLHSILETNKTPFFAWSRNAIIWYGAVGGIALYLLSWLAGKPTYARQQDFRNALIGWLVAGSIFGILVALGATLAHQIWEANPTKIYGTSEILLLIFSVPWVLASQLICETIFVGLTSKLEGSDGDREWLGRAAGWMLVVAFCWLVMMALVLLGSGWVEDKLYPKFQGWLTSIGGVSGLITALLGKSSYTRGSEKTGKSPSRIQISLDVILIISGLIFSAALIVVISGVIDHLLFGMPFIGLLAAHTTVDAFGYAPIPNWAYRIVAALVVVGVIGWIASKFVNINRFSLHALYRNRIVRAFLGGSNPTRAHTRNPFTDFDETDNIPMSQLWAVPRPANAWQPFHVINMALNIVSTKKLAWQERKAESFTASPLHSGSSCKAYRKTSEYGHQAQGISVGTAVAISGAAASPNMGYHSSPGIGFLLTLLNVRLGWWLGNPGSEGERTYKHEGPRTAIWPLLSEMFALTTDANKYVYLSDGGHFENLALYEMVQRRCRLIVVSDAGCDPKFEFEDLGNAVRKISLDFGVRIEFRGIENLKTATEERDRATGPIKALYHAIGTIHYSETDQGGKDGLILYIKPAYHGTENIGIRSYAMGNPTFPHESTGDQFFSESQFESYRALGFEITDDLLSAAFSQSGRPKTWSVDEIIASLETTVPKA